MVYTETKQQGLIDKKAFSEITGNQLKFLCVLVDILDITGLPDIGLRLLLDIGLLDQKWIVQTKNKTHVINYKK